MIKHTRPIALAVATMVASAGSAAANCGTFAAIAAAIGGGNPDQLAAGKIAVPTFAAQECSVTSQYRCLRRQAQSTAAAQYGQLKSLLSRCGWRIDTAFNQLEHDNHLVSPDRRTVVNIGFRSRGDHWIAVIAFFPR